MKYAENSIYLFTSFYQLTKSINYEKESHIFKCSYTDAMYSV